MKPYPIRCHIKNAGDVTRVDVYDDIGSDFFMGGVSAADFAATLAPVKGALEVHINSGGGNVFDGVAIAEAVRSHKGRVTTVVDGVAASIASVIFQAGSEREMAPGSMLMIHDASGWCEGSAADMAKSAEVLGKVSDNIAEQYAKRAGGTADEWRQAMLAESWYTAEEAVDAGLADRIGSEGTAMWPASLDVAAFSTVPGRIAASIRAMPAGPALTRFAAAASDDAKPGDQCPTCKGKGKIREGNVKCPDCDGTGKVKDPDGDGDDDTSAAGDTDHDYVLPDGSPGPKATPGNRADPFPILAAAVDNSDWDGGKAMANGAASDDPAKFYAGICAGRKAGDASTQAAWALPYKYHPGDAPNAAGVKNALARLPQTEGLTNASDAKATLEKAMKAVNPDYDPDALVSPGVVASAFTLPRATVDDSEWDPAAALAMAAASSDPAEYYRGICAGRRPGDPATPDAWALPYRYAPDSPPNATGVRAALAGLAHTRTLANAAEARTVLDKAMRAVDPDFEPDDEIDPGLLAAAFMGALG